MYVRFDQTTSSRNKVYLRNQFLKFLQQTIAHSVGLLAESAKEFLQLLRRFTTLARFMRRVIVALLYANLCAKL